MSTDVNDVRIPCGLQKILRPFLTRILSVQCVWGPVAAKWSMVKDEPVKNLLGQYQQFSDSLNAKYDGDKSVAPTHAEVNDAEMAALSIGAAQATEYFTTHPHITFCTDNAAAILALSLTLDHRHLLEADDNFSISVSWCPSHCDIKGNERADRLAKEAPMPSGSHHHSSNQHLTYANSKDSRELFRCVTQCRIGALLGNSDEH